MLFSVEGPRGATPSLPGPTWQTILVGGGGFMTGLDIAPDNTLLARSDTVPSLYLWSVLANKWLPLVTTNSFPFPSQYTNAPDGCWEARICPNLTSKFYMMYQNSPYVTTNSGGTWVSITGSPAFPTITDAQGNDQTNRLSGPKMAVDPQNHAICYIGTPSDGLWVTTNSGAGWTQISNLQVAFSTSRGIAIAFDPNSSVSGGKQQVIYAFSQGNGAYQSINGGSSWNHLNTTGMPTVFNRIIVDQNGVLHVVNDDNPGWYSWTSGGGWVHHTSASNQFASIAIDPHNINNIVLTAPGGRTYLSTDAGVTFPSNSTPIATTITATGDATWQAFTYPLGSSYGISTSATVFDSNSKLIWAYGFGMLASSSAFADATLMSIAVQAQSRGISGLDANAIIHPLHGNPVGMAWDLPIWNFTNVNAYPATYGPNADYGGPAPLGQVAPGWTIDYASSTPSPPFLVAVSNPTPGSCYSSDGGATWTGFPSQTPFTNAFNGGCIAASTTTNFVTMCVSDVPYYTTNGGTTWNTSTYAGTTGGGGPAMRIAADRVTPNKFYIYSSGDGVYSSTNSGQTFTKVSSFFTPSFQDGSSRFKCVPGHAGHLFYTNGFIDSGNPPNPNSQLFWNTNSGASSSAGASDLWTQVTGFTAIGDIGFGTTVSGQTYPTIYVAGWLNGVIGVWMCQNFNPSNGAGTWTLLGQNYPEGWFSIISGVAGDPVVDGACSISFINGGFKRFGV